MRVDITNPFMVQEFIRRGITKSKARVYSDFKGPELAGMRAEAEETIANMETNLFNLNDIASLHIDQLYRAELDKIRWWRFADRRDFEYRMIDWKAETRARLIAEAAAVESFEL